MHTDFGHLALPAALLTAPHTITVVTQTATSLAPDGTVTVTTTEYRIDTRTNRTTGPHRTAHRAEEPACLVQYPTPTATPTA